MWVWDGGSGDAMNACGTSKPSTRRIILTLTLAELDGLYFTTRGALIYSPFGSLLIFSEPDVFCLQARQDTICDGNK